MIRQHKTDGSKPVAQNWNGYNVYDGRSLSSKESLGKELGISETECQKLKHEEHIKELKKENTKLKAANSKGVDLWYEDKIDEANETIAKLKRSRDKLAELATDNHRVIEELSGLEVGTRFSSYSGHYKTKAEAIESWIKWSEQE